MATNTLTIGDTTQDGLAQITDTRWEDTNTLYVTVRELIGQEVDPSMYAKMRRLARRALAENTQDKTSRVVRKFWNGSSWSITFAVTRLPR